MAKYMNTQFIGNTMLNDETKQNGYVLTYEDGGKDTAFWDKIKLPTINAISSLTVTNKTGANGKTLEVTYRTPAIMNQVIVNGIKIFASKQDMTGLSFDDCNNDNNTKYFKIIDNTTTKTVDTTIVYDHLSTNTLCPFNIGDNLYYRGFIIYDQGISDGKNSSPYPILVADNDAPSDITSLTLTALDSSFEMSYTDPIDTDWASSTIIVTKNSYKNDENYSGSDLVYSKVSTVKNEFKTTPLIVTGLDNGVTYYVQVFLKDATGNVNRSNTGGNVGTVSPVMLQAYGVSYNASTNTWTRLKLADGKSFSDFNSINPYSNIKRLLLTDSKTKTYLKSTDSTLTEVGTTADITSGSAGNVFSEIPNNFYYKYEYINGEHRWYISETQLPGFSTHKAFIRNGTTVPSLYVGVYKGFVNTSTNKLESLSGKTPTISGHSFGDFRILAQARGSGFDQFDSLTLHLLQVLFIIKYGSPDYSSLIGTGTTLGTVNACGNTNSLGNSDSSVGTSTSLFGIENLANGGSHECIDGLLAGSHYWQADHGFSTMTSESSSGTYSQLSTTITPITTSGYIRDVEQIGSAFIGKDVAGSSSTGFYDYQLSKNGTGLNVMFLGSSTTTDANKGGLFANEFVDVTNMSVTSNMINTTSSNTNVTSGTEWTLSSFDKTVYSPKEISSISLIDGTTPEITVNEVMNNISGRLIAY